MSVIFAVVTTLQSKKEGKDKTILEMHLKKHKKSCLWVQKLYAIFLHWGGACRTS